MFTRWELGSEPTLGTYGQPSKSNAEFVLDVSTGVTPCIEHLLSRRFSRLSLFGFHLTAISLLFAVITAIPLG
jgi:hypothetical protein